MKEKNITKYVPYELMLTQKQGSGETFLCIYNDISIPHIVFCTSFQMSALLHVQFACFICIFSLLSKNTHLKYHPKSINTENKKIT